MVEKPKKIWTAKETDRPVVQDQLTRLKDLINAKAAEKQVTSSIGNEVQQGIFSVKLSGLFRDLKNVITRQDMMRKLDTNGGLYDDAAIEVDNKNIDIEPLANSSLKCNG